MPDFGDNVKEHPKPCQTATQIGSGEEMFVDPPPSHMVVDEDIMETDEEMIISDDEEEGGVLMIPEEPIVNRANIQGVELYSLSPAVLKRNVNSWWRRKEPRFEINYAFYCWNGGEGGIIESLLNSDLLVKMANKPRSALHSSIIHTKVTKHKLKKFRNFHNNWLKNNVDNSDEINCALWFLGFSVENPRSRFSTLIQTVSELSSTPYHPYRTYQTLYNFPVQNL